MDSVKEIVLTFCATTVFLAVINTLGGSSLEKSKRYIIALVMLCAILGSVAGARFDFSLPDHFESEIAISDSAEEFSVYQAEYLISELLRKSDLKFEKVLAKATKTEENSIVINEITLIGAEDKEGVLSELKKAGIDCRVIFD